MKTKFLFTALFMATIFSTVANNAKITGVSIYGTRPDQGITVTGKWYNGWNFSNLSTDAVYVFYKYRASGAQQWEHGNFMVPTSANASLQASLTGRGPTALGVSNGANFLNKGSNVTEAGVTYYSYRGVCLRIQNTSTNAVFDSVTFSLNVKPLLPNQLESYEFKFFVQEMVYIPQGSFYIGDGDSSNLCDAINHQPFQITSSSMPAANTLKLNRTLLPSISSSYPNGYKAFYVMKYALSNEAYADFLNMLTTPQQLGLLYGNPTVNTNWGGGLPAQRYVMGYSITPDSTFRSGIRIFQAPAGGYEFKCDLNGNGIGNEANDGQTIALMCNTAANSNAYLDWAGLRPLTDLEFEKASRGPVGPVLGELAWGNSNYQSLYNGSLVNPGTETEADAAVVNNPFPVHPRRCGSFARPFGSNRINTGASYYGVMDLSATPSTYTLSLFARMVNPSFVLSNGNAGDGYLSPTGGISDPSWNMLTYKWKVSSYGTYWGVYAGPDIYYNSVRGAISK